jgi:hypothetical protein
VISKKHTLPKELYPEYFAKEYIHFVFDEKQSDLSDPIFQVYLYTKTQVYKSMGYCVVHVPLEAQTVLHRF